ncbi:MAG: protein kinase [Deltaproteobacteria bacterium]|nr:protein kinase [Deltaproteobacteria bacterium]
MDRPSRIGKYDLEETLGSGGMATVYRGRDPDLQRDVAVKVLHPHLCSREESRMRFRREARAVARLKHPAVLEVYEAGEDGGRPFIVSELIRGGSLDSWATARRPIPAEVVAVIGLRTAEGLHAAHQAGIIHRDLKPGNILMGTGGKVKVADFGIAQIIDIEHLTSTGQILGSPAFMSPEHLEGARLDARADIFSLGTLLYWLATGDLPFSGPNPHAVLRKVLEVDYPDPARVRPDIGEVLAGVIRVCLERRPENRYASMADVASALRSVLTVAGAGSPDELIAAFEREPEQARAAILAHREQALLERCRGLLQTPGGAAEVRKLCSWILAWQPEHKDALRLVETTMVRRSRRRLAVVALAAALAAAVVAVWLSLPPTQPDRTDAADSGVAAVHETPRRRDAGAGGQPTPAAVETTREDGGAREIPADQGQDPGPAGNDSTAAGDAADEVAAVGTGEPPGDASGDVVAYPPPLADAHDGGRTDGSGHAPPPRLRTVSFQPAAPCRNFEIWVDGARLGVYGPPVGPNPGILSAELEPGEHRFGWRTSKPECYSAEWTETIPAGEAAYLLSRRLRLRPGTVIVDTGGVEAKVDIANRANGRANVPLEGPFEAQDDAEISIRVVVTFDGHDPVRYDRDLRAGGSLTIRVEPPAGELAAAGDAG